MCGNQIKGFKILHGDSASRALTSGSSGRLQREPGHEIPTARGRRRSLGAGGWVLLLGRLSLSCRQRVSAARGPKHTWPCLLPAPGGITFASMGKCVLSLGYCRKWSALIPRECHGAWRHLCRVCIWTEKVLAQLHVSRLKSDSGQTVSGACLFVQELKVSSDGKRRDFSR